MQNRIKNVKSINSKVDVLMAAMPPFGDYELGIQSRETITSKIISSTPGRATTPYLFVDGDKFIDIFFPKYKAADFEKNVASILKQSDKFFSDWAIALLCQTMYHVTSSLKSQLLNNKINSRIDSCNSACKGYHRANWYAFICSHAPNSIQEALDAIGANEFSQALDIYRTNITSQEWIDFKIAEGPLWTHPDWELFHHYIKLVALGADQNVVDNVINLQKSRGLPVPANTGPGQWFLYSPWGNTINYTAIQQKATPGILKEVCYVYPGSSFPSCMKESNSFEFTADSQPGNTYREPPSSCCFRANAMVVMDNGSLKAIEKIKAGEKVATLNGPKAVTHVTTSLLLDQDLYRFSNSQFFFTSAEAFVTANVKSGVQPSFVSVDPLRTMELVPTISRYGLTGLNHSYTPELLVYKNGEGDEIKAPQAINAGGGDSSEVLYDLVLDISDDGISEYFVGDENNQFYVTAEIPRFGDFPDATQAFMNMLQQCRQGIIDKLKEYPEVNYNDLLFVGLEGLGEKMLPNVINTIQKKSYNNIEMPALSQKDILTHVNKLMSLFAVDLDNGSVSKQFNYRTGSLYSLLAIQFGIPFYLACAMGWRQFPLTPADEATILAITVNAIELDGSRGLPGGDQFKLLVTLSRSGVEFSKEIGSFTNSHSAGYYHSFEQVVYFDQWRLPAADNNDPWKISFKLHNETTGRLFAEMAQTLLPDTIKTGYAFSQALVLDSSGNICGRITFDLRSLTAQYYLNEIQARQSWTAEKTAHFANELGNEAGKYLTDYFSDYLNVFGVMTTASSGGLIKPYKKP